MKKYIVHRLIQSVVVLFILSALIFLLVRVMPRDPVYVMLGPESTGVTPEVYAKLKRDLGLDRALPIQYVTWVKQLVTGDWGYSFKSKRPVTKEVGERIPYTVQLAVTALLISVTVGITAGVFVALRRNSLWDVAATISAMFGVAVPGFWLAIMLILLFSVQLKLLPSFGGKLLWHDPASAWRFLVLPAVILGVEGSATLMRQTRSAMLEVMGEDYIRTARAKGCSENRVVWRHAIQNALLPVVTILGIRLGHILGGSVIIETMFSWPGIGRLAVSALQEANYPVVQVIVMITGVTVLLANMLTDITYAYLDPRIQYT